MPDIIEVTTKEEYETAAGLFKEYADWLNIDLCFQGFDKELKQLDKMYARPEGVIFLIKEENEYIGCAAVRKKEDSIAELKRMYVRPGGRKSGTGTMLLNKALEAAVELGYKRIRLDTLDTMQAAIHLYKKAGFYPVEPYYFNPEPNALFFEKIL